MRNLSSPRLRAITGALVFCVAAAGAQDVPTLKVQARIVVLDVVVTDKAGHVVNDLKQDDFTILEDKAPQPIRSFEPPEQHVLPANVSIEGTEELRQKAPEMPVDVIVLDEFNTKFEDMAFARYSIEKYVKAQPPRLLQPTELVAISATKFQVLHDYTQNGEDLLNSMRKHLTDYPWNLNQGSSQQSMIKRLGLSVAALEQVAEATKGHPGRKNLIWVGRGFPAVKTIGISGDSGAGIRQAMARIIDRLRDARVTLYTIDPTSIATSLANVSNPVELSFNQEENGPDLFASDITFTTLAPATGGRAYFSRDDVEKSLDTSIRDGSNYYTMSYAPSNGMDGAAAYRRISIQVNRPGLTATTRNGYYPDAGTQPEVVAKGQTLSNQVIFDMSSALAGNLNYTGLLVTVVKAAGSADSFTLQIDPATLGWTDSADGSRETKVIVETGSFNKKDKLVGRTAREMTLHQAQSASAGQPVEVPASGKMAPGTTRIRFVVRDASSGHLGTTDFKTP